VLGREVARLRPASGFAEWALTDFNGKRVPAGVYSVALTRPTGGATISRGRILVVDQP
jgi:hypothetical protein